MLIYNNMRDATVEMKNVREGLDVDQVDDVVDVIDEEMSIMGQVRGCQRVLTSQCFRFV